MSTLVERAEVLAVDVSCSKDTLSVVLSDGRTVTVPLAWFPRLLKASSRQRADWELIGGGIGIHWEAVDEYCGEEIEFRWIGCGLRPSTSQAATVWL